jgi:catechol 2,3-dioxygenase-like lactoylglutathione lyase family enzyme
MSLIKIEDVAYVRFSVPDLDQAEAWFTDFGLMRANDARHPARTGAALFMAGVGGSPFLYCAELGAPAFLALGLRAESRADLKKLAEAEHARIETLNAPGGGEIVRLKDPDGLGVEIIHNDIANHSEQTERPGLNTAERHERLRVTKRLGSGPSQVVRLGHAVLNVTNFRRSESWYKEHFGFLTSDEITTDDGKATIGAFLRCDRGDQPTDHHTLFLLQGEKAGFNHAAFEVRDFDDLMTGHDYLAAHKYAHSWGVGRHILGSQIFDYWRDPWGNTMEHWTDGDLFSADRPPARATTADLLGSQWGPPFPGRL